MARRYGNEREEEEEEIDEEEEGGGETDVNSEDDDDDVTDSDELWESPIRTGGNKTIDSDSEGVSDTSETDDDWLEAKALAQKALDNKKQESKKTTYAKKADMQLLADAPSSTSVGFIKFNENLYFNA